MSLLREPFYCIHLSLIHAAFKGPLSHTMQKCFTKSIFKKLENSQQNEIQASSKRSRSEGKEDRATEVFRKRRGHSTPKTPALSKEGSQSLYFFAG